MMEPCLVDHMPSKSFLSLRGEIRDAIFLAISPILNAGDPSRRSQALEVLSQLAGYEKLRDTTRSIIPLTVHMLNDGDPFHRSYVFEILSNLARYEDPHGRIRLDLLSIFKRMNDKDPYYRSDSSHTSSRLAEY
ncbi:hypothetical protein FRC19_007423, partial [Serendipita sp. 401]